MVTDVLTLRARAKINLYLDVLGKLPNGYHAIETLFQSVELADILTVRRTKGEIAVECSDPALPTGDENLIVKAARLFFDFADISGGIHVSVEKRIPMGGGLGGGSADAAATLVALNCLYGTHYPLSVLETFGAKLGADVPFCVRGGTAWGVGTGTQLKWCAPLPDWNVLLVNPGVSVSTAWAYAALQMPSPTHGKGEVRVTHFGLTADQRDDMINGWRKRSITEIPTLFNRFEKVVFAAYPQIAEARDALSACGAAASMSGSGSAVFGIFQEDAALEAALSALRERFSWTYPTRFAARGIEVIRND